MDETFEKERKMEVAFCHFIKAVHRLREKERYFDIHHGHEAADDVHKARANVDRLLDKMGVKPGADLKNIGLYFIKHSLQNY